MIQRSFVIILLIKITYDKFMTRIQHLLILFYSGTFKTSTGFYVGLRSLFDTSLSEPPIFIPNQYVETLFFLRKINLSNL